MYFLSSGVKGLSVVLLDEYLQNVMHLLFFCPISMRIPTPSLATYRFTRATSRCCSSGLLISWWVAQMRKRRASSGTTPSLSISMTLFISTVTNKVNSCGVTFLHQVEAQKWPVKQSKQTNNQTFMQTEKARNSTDCLIILFINTVCV